MKLLVPLRMPWSDRIWLADRHWLMVAMIGMPPATDASKAIERPSSRARSKSSGPVLGQQGLVGGDDVLAAFQQLEHDRARRLQAADQFATALISGSRSSGEIVGQQPWGRSKPRSFQVAHHDLFDHSVRPAWRAVRSPWSSNSRATPEPTVPNPTMATLVLSMAIL